MNDSKIHAIMIITIILSLAVVAAVTPEYEAQGAHLESFTSYQELENFVHTSSQYHNYYPTGESWQRWMLPMSSSSKDSFSGALPEYSTTNVQVEGVEEADIVKTDGTYIYVVSNQTIIIVKAYPPEEAQIVSRTKFQGGIRGIYINEDKLAVFEDTGFFGQYRTFMDYPSYSYPEKTFIKVYNIEDKSNPTLTRNMSVNGSYFSSRMIDEYAYVIINQQSITYQGNITIPTICYEDRTEPVPPTDIFYANVTDNFNTFVNVLAVNILDDEEVPNVRTYLIGYASTMYVSQNNMYITYSTYDNQIQGTKVHRISIDEGDIEYEASGEVPGYVLNQFSMDEYNRYFRIATTTGEVWAWGEATSRSHVYVLDMDLNTVGALEDLAPGEKIYSARFMGNRCYLVTFKKIDPLFVIDLTDPTDPSVLGQLKITGYSDYLHPYDENHIVGIGKETAEAEEGNFAWYQGVKISLFDVTEVANPVEIAKYEIGDRGTDSPVLADHKAFLFNRERNLLVIPVAVAEIHPSKYPGEIPGWAYGDIVWKGAYIFHISLEQGLELRGTITHQTNSEEQNKIGGYYQPSDSIQRSLFIDNILYTISELKIKMNSLTNLTELAEINLGA